MAPKLPRIADQVRHLREDGTATRSRTPASYSQAASAAGRVAPKAAVTVPCQRCGKPYSNPLTHTCKVPSNFKKRKRADAKAKAAAARAARARRCR